MERLSPEELAAAVKILYQENGPLCDSEGFYNHDGECWNDALQMIFLNSDFCKEKVQAKLASAPVDPAEVDEKFRPYAKEVLQDLSNNDIYVRNYIGYIYTYLETLQKRFHRHYYAEHLRLSRARKDDVCTLQEFKGREAMKEMTKLSFLYRAKGREGTLGAYVGQNIKKYDLDVLRDPKKLGRLYESGGAEASRDNIIKVFSIFFDISTEKNNYVRIWEKNYFFFKNKEEPFKLTDNISSLYIGVETSGERDSGHAVSFYKCGNHEFYFDDNKGSIQFPWRFFFSIFSKNYRPDSIVSVIFNGYLEVKDDNDNLLFSHSTYPYLQITRLEKNKPFKTAKPVAKEFVTYLWDNTPIYVDSMKTMLHLFKFEKKIGDYNVTFTFERPEVSMYMITTIESAPHEFVKGRANEKSGVFLGARIRRSNQKYKELLLDAQLQKIEEGKAKIDDFFFVDKMEPPLTPLLYAIELNDIEYVKKVLAMGADIHKRGNLNETPLYACIVNDEETDLEICKLLLDKGAQINDNENYKGGYTPLMGSIIYNDEDERLEQLEFLLKNGADIHAKSKKQGATAIEFALFTGRYEETLKLLEKYGAKRPECPSAEELIKKREIFTYLSTEQTVKAGLLAKCYRTQEIYNELNQETITGETPLKMVLQMPTDYWSKQLFDILVRSGADVNYVDKFGMTPIFLAIQLQKKEFVQKLIDNGAKMDVYINKLGSVIEYAKRLGNPEIVEMVEAAKKKKEFLFAKPVQRKIRKTLNKGKKFNYTFKKRNVRKAQPIAIGGRKTRKN